MFLFAFVSSFVREVPGRVTACVHESYRDGALSEGCCSPGLYSAVK